jgi:hypothetical protein
MNTIEIPVNNKKSDWFEYLYFFMIVIYAGMASPFTKTMNHYTDQPIGFIIPVFMTLILLIRNPVSFYDTSFLLLIIVITVWQLLQFIKTSFFNASYIFFIYYAIFIAYIIIKVFQFNMFFLYEKIVTQLSLIAIIGWLAVIIIPGVMANFIETIKIPDSGGGTLEGNIIIFSMTNLRTLSEGENWGLLRNSGFSWEPGRYATMVVVALFFNMARTRFQFRRNIGFWILVIALATTQSTTGFVTFSLLILFFLINQKNVSKIFYLVLIIPLMLTIYNLPFVGEKIDTLADIENQRSKSLNDMEIRQEDGTYVPQRFDGMAYEFLNILDAPILGYGLSADNSYVAEKIYEKIGLSNGVFKVIARFGLIIGGLFYFFLYQSSKCIISFYNLRGGIIYMLIFVSVSISYDFTTVPFFLSSVMFYLFTDKKAISEPNWVYNKERVVFDVM